MSKESKRYLKKISQKVGLPPGSLVHIGEERKEKVKIELNYYDEEVCETKVLGSFEEAASFLQRRGVTWINIDGLSDVSIVEKAGRFFEINELVLEDILNTEQRAQAKDFEDFLFVVLKMANYDNSKDELITEQVSIIFGKNYVLSFQEGIEGDVFNSVRERIRKGKERIRKMGSDYLAHALIDASVDSYFVVLEKIGLKLEEIEEEILDNPSAKTIEEIHRLKRNLIFLRKAVWPIREVAGFLERSESPLIQKPTTLYFRDIYDHTLQLIDLIETFRDIGGGILDTYLSNLSNRLNEVMKVLTIISTIFIPLTFIAGVYGMNFHFMPELEWKYGYFVILFVMAVIAFFMGLFFKKKDWI